MRIYLDIDSRRLFSAPGKPLTKLEFKRRDNDAIELIFLRDNIAQELPAGTTAKVAVKVNADYASDFLAATTVTQSGTGTDTVYTGELNFNTTEMAAAFAEEPVTLAAMLEVEWLSGTTLSSSKTLPVVLHNDVIRGDEGDPATLPLFYAAATTDFQATQAQAEAGTDNTTWMSPLRTKEAIAALTPTPITSYADLTDIPTEFAPAAHTHAIADTTGLQAALDSKAPSTHTHTLSDLTDSGATTGQVATYDGTAWVPQDASAGVTSYNDLTDVPSTFAPSTHTHSASDITTGTLAVTRIPTGSTSTTVALGNHTHSTYAATSHTHSASDITTGTLAIARIPTGTTGTTVALGDHTHAGMLVGSGGITTVAVVSVMPATPDASTLYIVTA